MLVIMSNYVAICYAKVALLNLIETNTKITIDALFYEMNALFDLYDYDGIIQEEFKRFI